MTTNVPAVALPLRGGGGGHFCSKAKHGQCCTYGLKTTLKALKGGDFRWRLALVEEIFNLGEKDYW